MDAARLLVLAAALAAPAAHAATLESAVRTAVAERLSLDPGDVELAELPSDATVDAEWSIRLPDYAFGSGHVAITAEVPGRSIRLNPKVTLYDRLPVVDAEIAQGAQVSFHLERRALSELHGGTPVEPALAWDATIALHRGRVLTTGVVRRHPDLREGAAVTLVVQRGALVITAPGQLLADAIVDQSVKVLNLATKAELLGTLQADGRIHLGGS